MIYAQPAPSYWPFVCAVTRICLKAWEARLRSQHYIVTQQDPSKVINFHTPLSLLPGVQSEVRPKNN